MGVTVIFYDISHSHHMCIDKHTTQYSINGWVRSAENVITFPPPLYCFPFGSWIIQKVNFAAGHDHFFLLSSLREHRETFLNESLSLRLGATTKSCGTWAAMARLFAIGRSFSAVSFFLTQIGKNCCLVRQFFHWPIVPASLKIRTITLLLPSSAIDFAMNSLL